MRVWFDIDNPPQTRYLHPLARAFQEQGCGVLLTARDYGATCAILQNEGAEFHPVGSHPGGSKVLKVIGVAQRRRQLLRFLTSTERPNVLVSGSRSAVLVARKLQIPSFVIIDYEYVDLLAYEFARSFIVHPDVIDGQVLRRRGIRSRNLMPFPGLKEDLSFAAVDIGAAVPHEFGD